MTSTDGLQPAFEEAQQQAAAAGGHYASEAQAIPRVDVGDPPEASSLQKSNDHGANACEYAVVRSRNCVCVDNSWWQSIWSELSWALLRNGSGASL